MARLERAIVLLALLGAVNVPALATPGRQDSKEATGTISGLVTVDGKPAQGVIVLATSTDREIRNAAPAPLGGAASIKAITDQDGHYRFTGLIAGSYRVFPSALVLVAKSPEDSGRSVQVGGDQPADGVNFSLVRGGVLTGRITDAEGRPVIAELISLKAADGASVTPALPGGNRMYYTDDRGIYRIYGLKTGRYIIGSGAGSGVPSLEVFSARRKYPMTFYPGVTDSARAKAVEVIAGSETSGIDIQLWFSCQGVHRQWSSDRR